MEELLNKLTEEQKTELGNLCQKLMIFLKTVI